jgi:hypothetical protein
MKCARTLKAGVGSRDRGTRSGAAAAACGGARCEWKRAPRLSAPVDWEACLCSGRTHAAALASDTAGGASQPETVRCAAAVSAARAVRGAVVGQADIASASRRIGGTITARSAPTTEHWYAQYTAVTCMPQAQTPPSMQHCSRARTLASSTEMGRKSESSSSGVGWSAARSELAAAPATLLRPAVVEPSATVVRGLPATRASAPTAAATRATAAPPSATIVCKHNSTAAPTQSAAMRSESCAANNAAPLGGNPSACADASTLANLNSPAGVMSAACDCALHGALVDTLADSAAEPRVLRADGNTRSRKSAPRRDELRGCIQRERDFHERLTGGQH